MRIAILIKQVPPTSDLSIGPNGRLSRGEVGTDMNPHCRRALATGVEIAKEYGGTTTAITLGPPRAVEVLAEAIAFGTNYGVLVSDPAFAGSDSLATAKLLSYALIRFGPFDLVLVGRNSIDADTGQVAPQIAQLMQLPFIQSASSLALQGRTIQASEEHDDGNRRISCELPAIVACAERLCDPARATFDLESISVTSKITTFTSKDLVSDEQRFESKTYVGKMRAIARTRRPVRLMGSSTEIAASLVNELCEKGALESLGLSGTPEASFNPHFPQIFTIADTQPHIASHGPMDCTSQPKDEIVVFYDANNLSVASDLITRAHELARKKSVALIGIAKGGKQLHHQLFDEHYAIERSLIEHDSSATIGNFLRNRGRFTFLATANFSNREILSRLAADFDAAMIGDAFEVDVTLDDIIALKVASDQSTLCEIGSYSPNAFISLRPRLQLNDAELQPSWAQMQLDTLLVSRIKVSSTEIKDISGELSSARVVVGVGLGVPDDQYRIISELKDLLGGVLGATRRVTDRNWLPKSRQIGITGEQISPDLYFAIGISGKLNHTIGIASAKVIVAINIDPHAPIFQSADFVIVGDFAHVLPDIIHALKEVLEQQSCTQ